MEALLWNHKQCTISFVFWDIHILSQVYLYQVSSLCLVNNHDPKYVYLGVSGAGWKFISQRESLLSGKPHSTLFMNDSTKEIQNRRQIPACILLYINPIPKFQGIKNISQCDQMLKGTTLGNWFCHHWPVGRWSKPGAGFFAVVDENLLAPVPSESFHCLILFMKP